MTRLLAIALLVALLLAGRKRPVVKQPDAAQPIHTLLRVRREPMPVGGWER